MVNRSAALSERSPVAGTAQKSHGRANQPATRSSTSAGRSPASTPWDSLSENNTVPLGKGSAASVQAATVTRARARILRRDRADCGAVIRFDSSELGNHPECCRGWLGSWLGPDHQLGPVGAFTAVKGDGLAASCRHDHAELLGIICQSGDVHAAPRTRSEGSRPGNGGARCRTAFEVMSRSAQLLLVTEWTE